MIWSVLCCFADVCFGSIFAKKQLCHEQSLHSETLTNLPSYIFSFNQKQTAIPSTPQQQQRPASNWSDDRRPARPPRRSSGGWDDDDNTNDGGDYGTRRPAGRGGGRNNVGSGWDNNEGDGFDNRREERRPGRRSSPTPTPRSNSGGWDDTDDFGGDEYGSSSFEPYVYDKPSSNNRGRGSRNNDRRRDGGGGYDRRSGGRDSFGRGGDRPRREGRGGRSEGRGRGGRGRGGPDRNTIESGVVKINLKMIENAGYQHLYGIAPVLNALKANVRDFSNPDDNDNEEETEQMLELQKRLSSVDGVEGWDDEDEVLERLEEEQQPKVKKEIKPEAKLAPCLFVQEGTLANNKRTFRSSAKNEASSEILTLAQKIESLDVVEVDKGVLNTLCGNRPHQGFVLRCGGLEFEPLRGSSSLPSASLAGKDGPLVWLALDEVVDPQNLGALLRSAYFLGGGTGLIGDDDELGDAMQRGRVGILVCSKNSSPLTTTVSAASAGALEFMTVYSTSNLPKMLNRAREDGWRVLGAAADIPDSGGAARSGDAINDVNNDWDLVQEDDDEDDDDDDTIKDDETKPQLQREEQQCYDLNKVETGKPTILVLGSEGRGLRTLVARSCSGFVKVPGGLNMAASDKDEDATQAGVDSLNVSVTGGILLWHFLSNQ